MQFGKRRSLQCVMVDSTGVIHLRFFHFSAAQKNALAEGVRIRCYGEVRRGRSGLEIYHPEYRILKAGQKSRFQTHSPLFIRLQMAFNRGACAA